MECPTLAFATTLQVIAKVIAARVANPKAKAKISARTPPGNEEFAASKGGPKVVFMVPYFTNSIAVQRGQALRAAASNAVQTVDAF